MGAIAIRSNNINDNFERAEITVWYLDLDNTVGSRPKHRRGLLYIKPVPTSEYQGCLECDMYSQFGYKW